MMFAINPRRLPACHSYQQALEIYRAALPLNKNAPNGWRNLSPNRRETSKAVYKTPTGSVQFKFHYTVLVEWHSADHVALTRWDSRSSNLFINRFVPDGISAFTLKGCTWFRADEQVYSSQTPAPVDFIKRADGGWKLRDTDAVHKFSRRIIDRNKATTIRKTLKPWLEWSAAMRRLRGEHHLATADVWPVGNIDYEDWSALCRLVQGESLPFGELYEREFFHRTNLIDYALLAGNAVHSDPLALGKLPRRSRFDALLA